MSFCASLLKTVDGVVTLAFCQQVVSVTSSSSPCLWLYLRQDGATVPVHGYLCCTQDGATVTISGPISGTGTDSEGDVLDEDDAASDISPLSRTSSERSSGRLTRIRDKELSGNEGEQDPSSVLRFSSGSAVSDLLTYI